MPVVGKQNSLVVQCGLAIEGRAVAGRLRRARRGSIGLFQAWEGAFGDVPVLVVVSGMGMSEASIAATEVIRLFEPCGLVDFGTAGALSEKWPIGRCAIVRSAVAYTPPDLLPQPDSCPQPPTMAEAASDQRWVELGCKVLNLLAVRVGSADQPVVNTHLARYLERVCRFDWVDCESYSVLDAAARAGVPAVGLRTVSDHCGHDAPEQFKRHSMQVLRGAARVLESLVVGLHEAGLLTSSQPGAARPGENG